MNKDTEKILKEYFAEYRPVDVGVSPSAIAERLEPLFKQVQQQAYDDMEKIIGEDEEVITPKPKDGVMFMEDQMPKRVRNMLKREQRKKLKELR